MLCQRTNASTVVVFNQIQDHSVSLEDFLTVNLSIATCRSMCEAQGRAKGGKGGPCPPAKPTVPPANFDRVISTTEYKRVWYSVRDSWKCDISFNITTHNIVVKSAFAIQYSLALWNYATFNLQLSCFDLPACHVALEQLVTCPSFLANVTCASDFRKKLSDVS